MATAWGTSAWGQEAATHWPHAGGDRRVHRDDEGGYVGSANRIPDSHSTQVGQRERAMNTSEITTLCASNDGAADVRARTPAATETATVRVGRRGEPRPRRASAACPGCPSRRRRRRRSSRTPGPSACRRGRRSRAARRSRSRSAPRGPRTWPRPRREPRARPPSRRPPTSGSEAKIGSASFFERSVPSISPVARGLPISARLTATAAVAFGALLQLANVCHCESFVGSRPARIAAMRSLRARAWGP